LEYAFNFVGNLTKELISKDIWLLIGGNLVEIMLIFLLSRIVIRLGKSIIMRFFLVRSKSPLRTSERRDATLLRLLQNVLTYIVNFITIMMILEAVSIDVKAILAGAGIVGLAIGFGAQSLVKDIITGFFIILEDQFSVGDMIKVKDFEGEVVEIGLRLTKIKSSTGKLYLIPNGNILEVTNYSILNGVAVVDITIPNTGDITLVEKVLTDMFETLPAKYEQILKTPEFLGLQTLSTSEVVLRVTAETLPLKQWYIERILRKEIKDCLDAHEILSTSQGN
jgi:moderate conductance mechanosensitive channel